MPVLPSFPNAFTWRLIAACGLIDVILGARMGFTLTPRPILTGLAILMVMLTLSHFYTVWRPRPQFAYPTVMLAFFVANGLVFGPLTYITAGLGLPLVDAYLAAIDPYLGFDWRALQHFIESSAILSSACLVIYGTSGFEMVLVWIILGYTGQLCRLSVYMTAMVIATAACLVVAGLFPAVGAFPYWEVTPSGYLTGANCCIGYVPDYMGLRDGTLRVVDLSRLSGIVTFPSYHTIVALLCAWGLNSTRRLALPAAFYSGLVVFTTLPVGGHHLVDLFGGAAIAWLAVAAAWRVEAAIPATSNSLQGQHVAEPAAA